MTTGQENLVENNAVLQENLKKLEELSARLVSAVQSKQHIHPSLNAPGPDLMVKASSAYWASVMQNPAKLMEDQVNFWGQSVQHFIEVQQSLVTGQTVEPSGDKITDRRFANPMWESHPFFNYVKNQYLRNAELLNAAVQEIDDMPEHDRHRMQHFTQQIIDMMSPTNFLATNPDALEKAVETQGQSLLDGLENLISDIEANNGELLVKLSDDKAFEIGKNIATTPGKVVFRNRMMELIQFSPTTEQQFETPIVMFPPWINKYYILDLKTSNSLIKWITDQGYTLFVVSWVNPDPSYADVGLEHYIEEGYLKAIEIVKEITDQPQVNAIGYCIAGTTLALTLSLLKQRGDTSIKTATFFTALTDFSDQGEFTPFLQNDFVDGIEAQAQETGVLESFIMSRTFSYLRSNDLIYGPAIKSYMMGEAPPAFDLLYWNSDGANLPAKMVIHYLRSLCQANEFATDGFELFDTTLKLSEVDVPLMSIACETDHIAAWRDCYRGVQKMGSKDKQFILAQSGHIAGIVNPPSKKKYGHFTNPDISLAWNDWQDKAKFHDGTWWMTWENWIQSHSGDKVVSRIPGEAGYDPLCDAPGTYVLVKAADWKAKV